MDYNQAKRRDLIREAAVKYSDYLADSYLNIKKSRNPYYAAEFSEMAAHELNKIAEETASEIESRRLA